MKKFKLVLLLLTIISYSSCKNNNSNYEDSDSVVTYEILEGDVEYPDDTYCAEIYYYNPNTGTRSTYTLNVIVEDNELIVIKWPSGGWLDSSHFYVQELDSDGFCSITSYDGKQYDVQITGSECIYTDDYKVVSDEEDVTCPECGSFKSEYDDYCDYCKRKFTCPECRNKKRKYDDVCDDCRDKAEHTCKRCGQYDHFMWRSDELCSDCKREQDE